MSSTKKDDCCKGCLNGQPGSNKKCQAKLMMQAIEEKRTNASNNQKEKL